MKMLSRLHLEQKIGLKQMINCMEHIKLILLLCKIFIQHFSSAKKFAVINEIAVKSKKHKNFKNPKKFTIYIQ